MKIWAHLQGTTIQVVTKADYMYCQPNSRGMFQNLTSIASITWAVTGDHGFQTEDVTDMSYMFAGCTSLSTLTGIEKSNFTDVENMSHMFEGCSALGSVALNPVNTHNLRDTGMVAMFKGCTALGTVNLSSFTTNRVTSLKDFFMNCTGLHTINISSFNTASVTNMDNMFNGCASLRELDLSHFNTAQVTSMANIFNGCSSLTTLDISSFNTARITNMDNWFNGCASLIELDLSRFNTAQVTSMINLFNGCRQMLTLNLDNFDMSHVSNANIQDMAKDLADAVNIIQDIWIPCNVYCPQPVETAIIAHDPSNVHYFYSGLDDEIHYNELGQPVKYGNYYLRRTWSDDIGGFVNRRKLVFQRPSASK